MMQASPYPAQPGIGPGHPGMAHGHPVQMQHAGHMGQPNPGMMGGMHPAMSGPQVTQGGPMATGMPPNPGTSAPGGPMGNAMAIAHLGGQAPMFQGSNHPQMNMGQMQMNANMMARRQAMNMMQAQQGQMGQGMMNMQNLQGLNPHQLQQMKAMNANMNVPMQSMQSMQHMTPQQQQMVQQQQQFAHQHRMMLQHQANQNLMQQQQRQAQAQQQQHHNASQQMHVTRSQEAPTQPPQPVPTPAPQAQPQPQPQPQPTTQPQQQTPQQKVQQVQLPTSQPQPQSAPTPQIKQGDPDEDAQVKGELAKQQILDLEMSRPPNQDFSGQCILQLMSYCDCLASPARPNDYDYWQEMMAKYYSTQGSIRQQVYSNKSQGDKSFQLLYPTIARFYHTHFKNGVKRIWMQSYTHTQEALPNGGYHLWSKTLQLTYEYSDGVRVTAHGHLSVNFDEMQKIEHLFIGAKGWTEYIPRSLVQPPLSPEQNRQSPKMSKKALQNQQRQQQQQQALLPKSPVNEFGIPNSLQQFLEIAETMTLMGSLMEYYNTNQLTGPREALNRFNAENAQKNLAMQNSAAYGLNGQVAMPNGAGRMAGMNPPNQFQSPAFSHLHLPQNQQSPHMNHTPSPGHIPPGGVQMVHQMSAQGSNMSGSQGASTNTSPNVTNKRRRASAIKEEDAVAAAEGNKTKPSPRVGGKRQKGAPA